MIPVSLVIRRYFSTQQAELDDLTAQIDAITAEVEQLEEEHGGEDGLLSEAKTEKDKLTAASVKARLKAIGKDQNYADEIALLQTVSRLMDRKSKLERQYKEAQAELNAQVFTKYQVLGEEEVKTLVVDDKWLASLTTEIGGELDRVSQALALRLRQLAERYAATLPELTRYADELSAKVASHLQLMGFTW